MNFVLAAFFAILVLMSCNTTVNSDVSAARRSPTTEADAAALVSGMNQMAFSLYRTMAGDPEFSRKNLFLSPASISTALGMTYLGARTTTESQMAKALAIPVGHSAVGPMYRRLLNDLKASKSKDGYELAVANKIWTQEGFGFKPEFMKLTQSFFDSEVGERNFRDNAKRISAVKEINKWAADNTNNKIQNIVTDESIKADTRIVLANAIYFLGDWLDPFPAQDPQFKQELNFRKLDGKKVKVPQMVDKKTIGYGETQTEQFIELMYKGKEDGQASNLSMVIVLPSEKTSLAALEKSMDGETWSRIVNSMSQKKVYVTLPKWEVKGDAFKLKEPLTKIGMKDAFKDGVADFSGMTGKKNIFLSEVLHKTFVRVDELGTEAAAVTAVIGFEATSAPIDPPKSFTADRPFLYAIRDTKSGTILFVGRMVDPSSSK